MIRFEDIRVGDHYSFERTLSKKDVEAFAHLTGDRNPQHVDEAYGKKSAFKRNLAHGMLAGSLFSTLVGMHCPGEKCLYLSQSLYFKSPIFPDDALTVKGTVTGKNDSIRLVTLRTEILKGGRVAVEGEAKVKVME